ncbi:EAL domain-containing protein [Salinispirillum marinum]|uniref:EAL domain-containing protein n=2 Tax=Saccharospirillaceae TaxID=255527 RepID=A0ABV8BBS6_9GAMM
MKPDNNTSLNLMMLHRTQHEAEPLLSGLRNRGQAVRSHFVASADELNLVLDQQLFDIACVHLSADTVDPEIAIGIIQDSGKDIPIIGLVDSYTEDFIEKGLSLGAEAVVVADHAAAVVHVVRRAFAQLQIRRQKRTLEHLLTESERRCQLLLNGSKDAIAYVHEGMHIYANDSYRELFGYDDMEELACMPLMDLVHSSPADAIKSELKKVAEGKKVQLNVTGEHESGETFEARLSVSPASYEGEACIQITISKAEVNTEALQARVKELASLDAQTQLHNRQYFDDVLNDVVREVHATQGKRCLAFLQLVDMAKHKEQLGIAGTDLLLGFVADVLRKTFTDVGVMARYSDDAFALICPGDNDNYITKTERFVHAVSNHLFEVDGQTVQVELHGGISRITETTASDVEAITHAHEACMRAIKKHKDLVVYRPGDQSDAENSMVTKLRAALTKNQLIILFQPLVNLRVSSDENYEVLVRLPNEHGDLIAPQEFLEAANVADLACHLDRWVFKKTVLELAKHRRERSSNTRAFVHLTAATIQDSTFLPWANKALREAKLPGDAVVFQVSEQMAHNYLKALKAFSKGLNVLHARLAIGRFGHPDKAELLLRHLHINFIKVDPLYVRDLDNAENLAQLTNLISYIHQHEIASIVPHIENAQVMAGLWQAGVHYVQGHYLQQPIDAMSFPFEGEA